MNAAILVRQAGQFATIQDGGRRAYRRYGVAVGGAMDRGALALGNLLVGNPPLSAAVEFLFVGGDYEILADSARIAITGGQFDMALNGQRHCAGQSIRVRRGDRLVIGAAPDANWGYLAVAGGFALPQALGSLSTHTRSGLGGFKGRALRGGDALPLAWATDRLPDRPDQACHGRRRRPARAIRIVPGPQDHLFHPDALAILCRSEFRVTHRIDRMGLQLEGPRLAHLGGHDAISEGVLPGSLQVPGSGQPIALMADCQTTGGYPKIATIVTADLGPMAQRRPGDIVRFCAVSPDQARRSHTDFADVMAGWSGRLRNLA